MPTASTSFGYLGVVFTWDGIFWGLLLVQWRERETESLLATAMIPLGMAFAFFCVYILRFCMGYLVLHGTPPG